MYKEYILPLINNGKSREDIVYKLKNTTRRPISRKEARAFLFKNKIEWQNAKGEFVGKLAQLLAVNPNDSVERFLGYIRSTDWENIETHTIEEGPDAILLLNTLIYIKVITEAEKNGFLDLGGGIIYKEATLEWLDETLAEYESEALRESTFEQIKNKATFAVTAASNAFAAGFTSEKIVEAANQAWEA